MGIIGIVGHTTLLLYSGFVEAKTIEYEIAMESAKKECDRVALENEIESRIFDSHYSTKKKKPNTGFKLGGYKFKGR